LTRTGKGHDLVDPKKKERRHNMDSSIVEYGIYALAIAISAIPILKAIIK
jgi:hypothetical protein